MGALCAGNCRTISSPLGLTAVYVGVLVVKGSLYALIEDRAWTKPLAAAVTATTVGHRARHRPPDR